jgi:hypothetical protein
MRGTDVLGLLADQDPVDPCELPGPESAFGERLKDRILRSEAPAPRPRRRWTAVVVAAAAAAGLAVVALPHAFRGHELGASPAAAALNRAAEAAVSSSASTPAGRYAYSRARTLWSATSADDPPYTVLISRTVETWLAADGSGLVREGPGKLVFPGPRDRARWLAAGAPAPAGRGGDQRYRPHAPQLAALAQRNPDDLDAAQLDALMNAPAALPTDPVRLERLVRAYAKTKDPPLASMMFNQLTELAGESWGSAELRAAAYRALAHVDGVELAGEARDPLGRRGVGLVAPVGYTDEIRSRLIVDPHSGDVLTTETVLARRADWIDAAPGDVIGQVVYVDSGWVDELGRRPSQ